MHTFVMMPFNADFLVVRESIRDAANRANIECVWADEITSEGRITDQIISAIRESTACIADVSGQNANVAWEIGYAQALGKPLMTVAQSSSDLFFDVKDRRTILYDLRHLGLLAQKLTTWLIGLKSATAAPEDLVGTKGHEATSYVVAAKRVADSPYVFSNLIARAHEHIFLAAQNHFFFLEPSFRQEQLKTHLLEFLKTDTSRRVDIMLCNPAADCAVHTWQYVTAKEYKENLIRASAFFDSLVDWAHTNGFSNRIRIRRVPLVPFSVTFVDPDQSEGFLVFTPNAYEESNRTRPCFILSKRRNDNIFGQYWAAFSEQFDNPDRGLEWMMHVKPPH